MKIHCSVLAEDAIKSAIADYRKKQADRRAKPRSERWTAATSPSATTAGASRVTPQAVEAIARQMKKRGTMDASLRLGIRGGGCSGFSYVIEFHDGAPHARDRVFDYTASDGTPVRVVVDPKSLLYLSGTVLEWEQTLMQQGFKFVNPQREDRLRLRPLVHRVSVGAMDPFATLGIVRALRRRPRGGREDAPRAVARAPPGPLRRRAGASERRAALTKAVEVNEAWRIVRDPIRRAEALLRSPGSRWARTERAQGRPRVPDGDARAARGARRGEGRRATSPRCARWRAAIEERAARRREGARPRASRGARRRRSSASWASCRFYRRFLDEVSAIEDELASVRWHLFEIFDPKAPPRPIGIDLGTTNSLVAYVQNERPVAIADCDLEVARAERRRRTCPSGEVVVGRARRSGSRRSTRATPS